MKTILKRSLFAASFAGAMTIPVGDADAALASYLKLKGQTQGDIQGSVTTKGKEGMIMVIAVSHEIISPRDAASGLATGKRQHKPLKITMEFDQSMPRLNEALVKNENITEFELTFWATSKSGKEVAQYKIRLSNASVSAVALNSALGRDKATFDVSFTYQKIEWIWVDSGISAMDDWETGMQGAHAPAAPRAPRKKPK